MEELLPSLIPSVTQLASTGLVEGYNAAKESAQSACSSAIANLLNEYSALIEECKQTCDGVQGKCTDCYAKALTVTKQRVAALNYACIADANAAVMNAVVAANTYIQGLGVSAPTQAQIQDVANQKMVGLTPQLQSLQAKLDNLNTGLRQVSGSAGSNTNTSAVPTAFVGNRQISNASLGSRVSGSIGAFNTGASSGVGNASPLVVSQASVAGSSGGGSGSGGVTTLGNNPNAPGLGGLGGSGGPIIGTTPTSPPAGGVGAPTLPGSPSSSIRCEYTDSNGMLQSVQGGYSAPADYTEADATAGCASLGLSMVGWDTDPLSGVHTFCCVPAPSSTSPTSPPPNTGSGSCQPCPYPPPDLPTCPDGSVGYLMSDGSVKCDTGSSSPPPPPPPPPPSSPPPSIPEGGPITDYCAIGSNFTPPSVNPVTPFDYQESVNQWGQSAGQQVGILGVVWNALELLVPSISSLQLPTVGDAFKSGFSAIFSYIGGLLSSFAPCSSPDFAEASTVGMLSGFLDKFGVIPPLVNAQVLYTQNYYCQYLIPGQGQLDTSWVKGQISDDDWTNGTRMNGNCLPWAQASRDSGITTFSTAQAIEAKYRSFIGEDQYNTYLSRAGVRRVEDVGILENLSSFNPPVQLAVLQHITGADDDGIAQTLGTSEGYSNWFGADGAGVVDSNIYTSVQAERIYRQSRRLPDIPTAIDAYRRIQQPIGIDGTGQNATPVAGAELSALLAASGYPSQWAARIAALSYQPISQRYLKTLYETGQLTKQQLATRYSQLGFLPDDAQLMSNALAASSEQAKAKLEGMPSATEILSLYKQDGLSFNDAVNALISSGVDSNAAAPMVNSASTIRDANIRKSQIQTLKKRFLMGDYDIPTVQAKLNQYGVVVARIGEIISEWQEELSLEHKLPAVSELCKWLTRGYIGVPQYMASLANLGYDSTAAANFVASCVADQADKIAAKAAAAAKAKAAQDAKNLKAEQAAIKAAQPCTTPPKPVCGKVKKATHKVTRTTKVTSPAAETVTDTVSSSIPVTQSPFADDPNVIPDA